MAIRLLPLPDDFVYRGLKPALWLFGLLLAAKLAIALGAIFNGHYAAVVADGIPIDSYTENGARAFISLFASLGLGQLMFSALGVVVLFRYQALVPLMLLAFIGEFVARKIIAYYLPVERIGASPGGLINWAIFGVMVAGFLFSIRTQSNESEAYQ